ncbi:SDR family oxidoreductase [uncultured Paludibaculum sp.]|uniref:SDR family NAD(P)-dependent oxidoreductase n=1 Tax=uncultured Paludibaculum sp. TaxID=1765020 RepID=UPI002AABFC55|nr:SDR family oxidoreductase [uncultured Paludibaculum sp.]
MRLKDKVAIVTGGAHGIGRAIAELFAEEGAAVLIADLDAAAGTALAESVRSAGGRAEFWLTDVGSKEAVAGAVEIAARWTGRIDVLCNNAAYLGEFHGVLDASDEEWDRCLRVQLLGTNNCTRAVLPFMLAQKAGSIVNVVSIQAMVGCPTSVAYTAAKAGLLGFTMSAAYDYGKDNIRVNSLCPGPIQTRISPKPGEAAYEWQCSQTMLGRVGQPREVAQAALFLASDESSFVTGATLAVDGGWTAK